MMRRGRAVLVLALLLTGACARSSGPPEVENASPPPTSAASSTTGASPARTAVPDVVVRDVATGADVNLRALGLPDRPTLYWFWAPH